MGNKREEVFVPDTAIELRTVWRAHFKAEIQHERIRQSLHSMAGFNIYEAFNSVDLNNDGQVHVGEVKRLIESRGLLASEKDAALLVIKMDRDKDSLVRYNDFRMEIMPWSH